MFSGLWKSAETKKQKWLGHKYERTVQRVGEAKTWLFGKLRMTANQKKELIPQLETREKENNRYQWNSEDK